MGLPKLFVAVLCLLFISLNLLPLGGLIRGFPIVHEGNTVPLGSLFPNVPLLYNPDILNGGVFETIVIGAQRFFNGENVYDMKPVGVGPFRYPPSMLIVGGFFSMLPMPYSYWVWLLLNIIMVGYTVRFLAPEIPSHFIRFTPFIVFAFILSTPLIRQLAWGHYIIPMLFLTVLIYRYRERWMLSGMYLGLLSNVSLFGLIFLPYFFFKKRYKALVMWGVITVLSYSILLINSASLYGFIASLSGLNTGEYSLQAKGFFSVVRMLYGIHPMLYYLFVAGIVSLFGYSTYCLYRGTISDQLYFAHTIFTLLLLNPSLSEHHLPLVLIAYVFLIGQKWWRVIIPVAYLLTDVHYDFFHDISLFGYSWFTYVRYSGLLMAFIYASYTLKHDIKTHTTAAS